MTVVGDRATSAGGTAAAAERALSRRARVVALVLVAAMGSWLGLQWLGGAMGWPPGLAFALDLAALAAFAWALAATYGIWRRRRGIEVQGTKAAGTKG